MLNAAAAAPPVGSDRTPGPAGHRRTFYIDGRHRTVAAEVQRQILRWLRSVAPTDLDVEAFGAGMCDVGGGMEVLGDAGRSDAGVVTRRWRLRRIPGVGNVTVVVRSAEVGRAWILVESESDGPSAVSGGGCAVQTLVPGAAGSVPVGLVRLIVDALDARDGQARLTSRPQGVATAEDARALVEAILDEERRLPLLVVADAPSVRRAEWESRVVRFLTTAVGVVSCYALMPTAMTMFTRMTSFDAAGACSDGAILVYLPRGKEAAGQRPPRPDGELGLNADGPAAQFREFSCPASMPGLFAAHELCAAATRAPMPLPLIGIPSFLGHSLGGDANFGDDPARVRELLAAADARAMRAEHEAAGLAAQLADLRTRLADAAGP
ncbi:MAG: hypothetical protein HOV68_09825 [Streptomycetaceae bacterium]|nr:hypothetical protein [Streptomycetaceae bacterium]